ERERDDEERRGPAGAHVPADGGDADVGAERVERAAGEVENLLHAEDDLKPGRDEEQDGRVKETAEQDVDDVGRQTFQPLIQSKSFEPAGFIACLVETISIGLMVTKSYAFLCVVIP